MCPQPRSVEAGGRRPGDGLAASLTAVSALILIGFLWPGLVGRLAQALWVTSMPVLLILLGTAGNISRRLSVAMAALWLLLGGSWALLIWVDGAGVPLLGGTPVVLWALVFGLGILPLILVSLAYAVTFGPNETVADRPERGGGPKRHAENGSS